MFEDVRAATFKIFIGNRVSQAPQQARQGIEVLASKGFVAPFSG